jgi:hypothetical protein
VTVIAKAHFRGRCLGPAADPQATPEAQMEAVSALCAQATTHMPRAGESGLETASPWLWEVRESTIELMAGCQGEQTAGYPSDDEASTLDSRLAVIYATTFCAPAAIPAYLAYCQREAAAILEAHWPALKALAEALDTHGTLSGAEVDQIISEALARVDQAAEQQRRETCRRATQNALTFVKEIIEHARRV